MQTAKWENGETAKQTDKYNNRQTGYQAGKEIDQYDDRQEGKLAGYVTN